MGLAGNTSPTYTSGWSLTGTIVSGASNPNAAQNAFFYGQTGVSYDITVDAGANIYNYVDNAADSPIYTDGTVEAETAFGTPNGEVIAIDSGTIVNEGLLNTYPLPPAPGTNNNFQKTADIVYVATTGVVINAGTIGDLTTISKASNTGTPPYGFVQWDYEGIQSNGGFIENTASGLVTGFNAIATNGIGSLVNYGTLEGNNDSVLTTWDVTNYAGASISTTVRGYASIHGYADITNDGYILGDDYGILSSGNRHVIEDYAGAPIPGVLDFDGSQVFNGEISSLNQIDETAVLSGSFSTFDAVNIMGTGTTLDLHAGIADGSFYLPVIVGPMEGGFNGTASQSNTLIFNFGGLDGADYANLAAAIAASHLTDANGTYYSGAADIQDHHYQWEDFAQVELACFAAGTGIATPLGKTPVETLRPGDRVRVAGAVPGEAVVRWVGHRRIDPTRHLQPDQVQPVRIAAGAFAPGVPHRDLLLSPDHAVLVDGVLMPIKTLMNGHSIAQVAGGAVEYWHVELDRHDILLAEGLPAESYLDTGNRASFAVGATADALHPWPAASSWADACAELVEDGPRVVAAKARLFARAGIATEPPSSRVELRAGDRRMPCHDDGCGVLTCDLPPGLRSLAVMSKPWVPAWHVPASLDRRRLGIRIFGVALDGRQIALDHPVLSRGFHPAERTAEGNCRWTDGNAGLELPAGTSRVALGVLPQSLATA